MIPKREVFQQSDFKMSVKIHVHITSANRSQISRNYTELVLANQPIGIISCSRILVHQEEGKTSKVIEKTPEKPNK